MCEHCGCSSASEPAGPETHHGHHDHLHDPDHAHEHPHPHDHGAAHTHLTAREHGHFPHHEHPVGASVETSSAAGAPANIERVDLAQNILARNEEAAARNRAWLTSRGVTALNLISSPGAGKTLLLERTLDRLRGRVGCAVITGDVRTDHDARRLAGRGAAVRQIETLNACHLTAEQVGRELPAVVGEGVRLLFIENVGNLVCPAAFDLGEHFKVAILSTTEGEDKPLKYPAIFSAAQLAILTKLDLVGVLDWDLAACRRAIQAVHPGMYVFELSARTGEGMDAWIEYLVRLAG